MATSLRFFGLMMAVVIGFYGLGHLQGYQRGKQVVETRLWKAAMEAQQMREEIEHEIGTLAPVDLCVALGGMSEQCTAFLRGMEQAAESQSTGTIGQN